MRWRYVVGDVVDGGSRIVVREVCDTARRADARADAMRCSSMPLIDAPGRRCDPRLGDVCGIYTEAGGRYAVRPLVRR